MNRRILGIIVNPIAGLGGAAGLKGTDSPEIVAAALARGAVAQAPARMIEALRVAVEALRSDLAVLAAAGAMGEDEARVTGLSVKVIAAAGDPHPVPLPPRGRGDAASAAGLDSPLAREAGEGGGEGVSAGATTAADTQAAARAMLAQGVALILFAGGDGTARDIYAAVGERMPVVGVPAGVKMHSAVYATTPQAAGELVVRFLRDGLPVRPVEVMDIDETAYRAGEVSARLYGYLNVPFHRDLVQGVKAGRVNSDAAAVEAIAEAVIERLVPGRLYILGPGTTTRAIARRLGLDKTLLGIDLLRDRRIERADVDETTLLTATQDRDATIIVTPIGGQGHFLGRGNQQISAAVVRQVGRANLLVVATPQKLASLQGRPLRVDTGDPALDRELAGYIRVITGYRTESVCPVRG